MWTLYWLVYDCLIVLSREWAFADDCVDRGRRPLILVWGDSTAGALMPGLRKAQESRAFGLAQFTASSCIPALNTDVAGAPYIQFLDTNGVSLRIPGEPIYRLAALPTAPTSDPLAAAAALPYPAAH